MSKTLSSTWRDALNSVVDSISAERFRENLPWLREKYGDDPDDISIVYTGMLTDWFVESTGLFAALQLPPEEVPAALAEIRKTLAHLDFDQELKQVKRHERRYYDRFAITSALLFTELGEAMEALFNHYVTGDYDPKTNPNDLVAEALEIAKEDLERAHHLITQAGAIALHSHPLWWRWQAEAYGPAEPWLTIIANLVEDYTGGGQTPLGPLAKARAEARATVQEVKEKEEEPELPVPAPSPVDDLIEELIEQGEAHFAPEQLALCQVHREEAIPALIDLAADEYLQMEGMEGSLGDGYAPINAVQLLGELEAVEAIPALIDLVADVDPEAIIYSSAIYALKKIGPPALDPLLTFIRYSRDAEAKVGLAEAINVGDQADERVYQALATVWQEATWEEGKCLLAYLLVRAGGEQAIPLLQAALGDPNLDNLIDYNEVAHALTKLGVKAPPPPVSPERLDFDPGMDIGRPAHAVLLEVSDPARLMTFADEATEEWRSHPEALAHAYTAIELNRLNSLFVMQAILLPPEFSMPPMVSLIEVTETLTFDSSTRGYPHWLRKTYDHLAECAGPELRNQLAGVLLSLQYYLGADYDIADDPDQLLAAARRLSYEEEAEAEELGHLFGRAGALILHGRSFWSRWPAETDLPLCDWLGGLIEFRRILKSIGQIPLRPSTETTPDELSVMLFEAMIEMEEKQAPPTVAKLLDVALARKQDTMPPAQRRRFTHQRAAVIPYLIRLVEDKQYWHEDGPGGGWAAILAVRLLGELKATQATDTLVSAVADSRPEDIIHEAALFSLMNIGRPAISAVQAYFRYGRDVETKTALAEVLGCIGRRNTDVFDLLRRVWETADWAQNRRMVALAFGDLRDRRAIPFLQAAWEDQAADGLDLDYVHWALHQLGAPAPPLLPQKPSRLKTPASYNPRLIYDEFDTPQRLRYTAWGEPLCPDCGQPLVRDENGEWTHSPELPDTHSDPRRTRRKEDRRR